MPSCLRFLLILLVAFEGIAVPADIASSAVQQSNESTTSSQGTSEQDLAVMRPDHTTRVEWIQEYNAAQKASYESKVRAFGYPTSFSLLDHIQYTPSQRNQGYCGNCWAWAGTGVLETALDVQGVNKDRLSLQYLNSNYNGGSGSGFACCGGWLSSFASFYASQGRTIPWSNTNAAWADALRSCGGSTSVSAASIGTTPNYPFTSITDSSVVTQGVGQAAAINNIKNVLLQNKAIWFGFFMATASDGDAFESFWLTQGEAAVWNPDPYSGHSWADGWGHAVLLVGYDDSNPSNRYWIILNSWGTAGGSRPYGLYRMKMDIDYDAYFYDPYPYAYYSLYFQTLDVTFQGSTTTTTTVTGSSTLASTSYAYGTTTRTVTSYTSTTTSTSMISTLTTVALLPLTSTSTVQSTQLLASLATTTVTSYTGTQTLTSTTVVPATVTVGPSTITTTVQTTQVLTSTGSTTVTGSTTITWTNYTATTTSTSTTVVHTTVTVSRVMVGGASNPLTYVGLLSLPAVTMSWRIPSLLLRKERRCPRD